MGTGKSVDLNVYWQLRNLGFEESIALKAASKFPEDICKAQNYILNNSTRSNKMPKFIDKCESTEKCESIKRMISILKYQCTNNIDINASELLSKSFLILNDYHHILDHHLNEDNISKTKSDEQFTYILNEINFKCELITCNRYIRNNRQRETRKLDYDCNLSMYVDLLDTIHCLFLHSTDTGYRIIPQSLNTIIKMWPHINDDHDNKLNNNHNLSYDKETVQLKAYLSQKRKLLQAVKGTYRLYNNKFMTPIMSQCNANLIDTDEKKFENCDINASTFGEFWGGSNGSLIMIKYESMKEELLNNKLYPLQLNQFQLSMKKAQKFIKTEKAKQTILWASVWNDPMKYEIQMTIDHHDHLNVNGQNEYIHISLEQLLVIIIYCDWTDLCSKFGESFRKKSLCESMESVKNRNKEFAICSRLLRESVEYFGDRGFGELKYLTDSIPRPLIQRRLNIYNEIRGPFFCGLSFLMVMPHINIELCGPTSTSLQIEVAARFAGAYGTLLQLNNNGTQYHGQLTGFPCSWVSQYPQEDEIIFCGGGNKIQIESVINMITNENWLPQFIPLFLFDCMISDGVLTDKYNKQQIIDAYVEMNKLI
eukprot:508306_1